MLSVMHAGKNEGRLLSARTAARVETVDFVCSAAFRLRGNLSEEAVTRLRRQ